MPPVVWRTERHGIDLAAVVTRLLGPAPGRRGESHLKLWWPCPFHEDRNPSFCVTPGTPWWRCYGCGAKGDAAALVMRREGMTFPEAVTYLTGGLAPIRKAPTRPVARPTTKPPAEHPRGSPRQTPWPSWKPPKRGCGPPREPTPWPT
jgi:hypothetical protein